MGVEEEAWLSLFFSKETDSLSVAVVAAVAAAVAAVVAAAVVAAIAAADIAAASSNSNQQ